MISVVKTCGFKASEISDKLLERLVLKLESYLPKFASDLPFIQIMMAKKKSNGEIIEGKIKLVLPKKILVAHFKEKTLGDSLRSGFKKIYRQFQTYKSKHFKGSSKYPDHNSIRYA